MIVYPDHPHFGHRQITKSAKQKAKFFVDLNDKNSIDELVKCINDSDYYEIVRIVTVDIKTKVIVEVTDTKAGTFDSEVYCRPCSNKKQYDVSCGIVSKLGGNDQKPNHIGCYICGTKYYPV